MSRQRQPHPGPPPPSVAVVLRPLSDLALVEAMLAAADLPFADVREPGHVFLRAAGPMPPTGIVGLEPYGADALLRSLVVGEASSGRGAGRALVEAVIGHARGLGIRRLWLLTTSAAGFFEKLGFQPADRSSAPAAIQGTRSFRDLCPSSAACLSLRL